MNEATAKTIAGRLQASLPLGLRRGLRLARVFPATRSIGADGESRSRFWRLLRTADAAPGAPPQAVRVKALDGAPVWLRPGTSDAEVALSTFGGAYHLPPAGTPPPRVIWDLGANIGLTMLHMGALYPEARLLGVELEPANVRLARRNLQDCRAEWDLREAAVWSVPGGVRYGSDEFEDGYHVEEAGDSEASAVTMEDLLGIAGPPDYVKMDIEGAEREVLRGPQAERWAHEVPVISVECHPPYTLAECAADLERLGFAVKLHPQSLRRRARDCAVGTRPQG